MKDSESLDIEMANDAAYRVNSVIQKMTEPPETVLAHLKRIGINPVIDFMVLDDQQPKTYVLFEYEELLEKELEAIAKGNSYSAEYPKNVPATPIKIPAGPILLEEVWLRTQADKKSHPSRSPSADELEVDDDDEWPITGENPL